MALASWIETRLSEEIELEGRGTKALGFWKCGWKCTDAERWATGMVGWGDGWGTGVWISLYRGGDAAFHKAFAGAMAAALRHLSYWSLQ